MPDDEPKCSGGSRRRRQKTARAPVVRSVVGSRWDVRIRPSPRSSAPARPEPRFQSYSANGPFARPTRERSGLERPDLSPVASHPSRAPGRSGNSGSDLSRFAGSCAVGSVRWCVPSMLQLILRVISLSNLCLGSIFRTPAELIGFILTFSTIMPFGPAPAPGEPLFCAVTTDLARDRLVFSGLLSSLTPKFAFAQPTTMI